MAGKKDNKVAEAKKAAEEQEALKKKAAEEQAEKDAAAEAEENKVTQKGLTEDGKTTVTTSDHPNPPKKVDPPKERINPPASDTVTVRGNEVGGITKMTREEYAEFQEKRNKSDKEKEE